MSLANGILCLIPKEKQQLQRRAHKSPHEPNAVHHLHVEPTLNKTTIKRYCDTISDLEKNCPV